MDKPLLFKRSTGSIFQRRVLEEETESVITHYDASTNGGHAST